jgi:hypothetical protein
MQINSGSGSLSKVNEEGTMTSRIPLAVLPLVCLIGGSACTSATEPTPTGQGVWVLESIGGQTLPASVSGAVGAGMLIHADTLSFESDPSVYLLRSNEAIEYGWVSFPPSSELVDQAVLLPYRGGNGFLDLTTECPPQTLCTVRVSRFRIVGDRMEREYLDTKGLASRLYRRIR